MAGKLKKEIQQKKPFASLQEEVILTMMRTLDRLIAPGVEVLRAADLSQSQYNVLRILRGAGKEGLPCGEIAGRMISRDPDLTRLLDRLESRRLVSRARGTADRRVVCATITKEGLGLLASLDDSLDETVRRTLAHVPKHRLRLLRDLLDEVRGASASR
jgi:DNA-binding MarR family transcriptional regulator